MKDNAKTKAQLINEMAQLRHQLADLESKYRQAETAWQECQAKYDALIEQSDDAIYLIYGNKFEVINHRFEELFGVTQAAANAPDFTFTNIVAPKSRVEMMGRATSEEDGRKPSPRYEFTARDKADREIEIELTVSYPTYRGGLATQGVLRDITERKQLEDQLYQAQKMEAIGRLASGVAHDFNNALTVITGYCELLLLHHSDPDDPLRDKINQIQKAAEQAASLTHQLLAFSRKQVLQPTLLDLNFVVGNMEKMLRPIIGKDIELVTVPELSLGQVKADRRRMEQVIMNLVINARDAMPQGGKLTLETANVELDEAYTYRHPGLKPGPYVMMAISDTGHGMDETTQARIFEPFFTTKKPGQGTGLGLASVYGIINQGGGHVGVVSEPGQGTTFKIYLPRVEEFIKPTNQDQAPAASPGGSETILLVENNDMVRELAHSILLKGGYSVLEAPHSAEAIQVYERHPDPIDLLVTDIMMLGGMRGDELAQYLRQQQPEMKVLYMSGYPDRANAQHGVLGPETAFLAKPFTPGELVRKVREVLDIDN